MTLLPLCCCSVCSALQNACDDYLRSATEDALAARQQKQSGKKKSAEELAKLAIAGKKKNRRLKRALF
eukprot:COSAG06_NODE_33740_length_485_cov_0.621762_1_plen_67_part_10